MNSRRTVVGGLAAVLVASAGGFGGWAIADSGGASAASAGGAATPTVPQTPSLVTDLGTGQGSVRTYTLTASQFQQKIANFPLQEATVWGYNGSTPGPTLVAYQGDTVRVVLHNNLPVPTTLHFHGMGEPNTADGVAGISQPNPIPSGGAYTYTFTPRYVGTFAYHSHTDASMQEARGLEGMFIVLPRRQAASQNPAEDFAMTVQQFDPATNGALVSPNPPGMVFPYSTINGKTGDASGGPLVVHRGDLVELRLYNNSMSVHAMHLHGEPMTVIGSNYLFPQSARYQTTTVNLAPGQFAMVEFRADNPGNWVFHCAFPGHTANDQMSGWNGSPVGMTRIFHYAGYAPVPPQYFTYTG